MDGTTKIVETYLFDFKKMVYGEIVQTYFYKFIREEQKFPSVEALRQQMERDAKTADAFLKESLAKNFVRN